MFNRPTTSNLEGYHIYRPAVGDLGLIIQGDQNEFYLTEGRPSSTLLLFHITMMMHVHNISKQLPIGIEKHPQYFFM